MSLTRTGPGDAEVEFSIYNSGKRVETPDGKYDLTEYLAGWEVFESISSATQEAKFVIEDQGGLLDSLTGTEEFRLLVKTGLTDRTYYFRTYQIESRVRVGQSSDFFQINACSNEFVKNEVTNVFGSSEKIFNKKIKAEEITRVLVKDRKFLNSKKKIFLEETLNKQTFVAPNWRAIDTIFWCANRSIRKNPKGGTLQNGFLFWENALGFNFKSIDKIIDDVNDNDGKKDTDMKKGIGKLYTYVYSPKNFSRDGDDQYSIDTITFPDEKSYLMGLRHGTWSGYSVGFDPVNIVKSRWGVSTDMKKDEYRYGVKKLWKKMSHIGKSTAVNPVNNMDDEIRNIVDFPKRVRYTMLPNQIFDPKYKNNPQSNYEELVELQAYQWMRIETLRNIRMVISVPGNLDLYAGNGVKVDMPATRLSGDRPIPDKKYNGKWVIAGINHSGVGSSSKMKTELFLCKDSVSKR